MRGKVTYFFESEPIAGFYFLPKMLDRYNKMPALCVKANV